MEMRMVMRVAGLGGAGGGGSGFRSLAELLQGMGRMAGRLAEQMKRYGTNQSLLVRARGDLTPVSRDVGGFEVTIQPLAFVHAMRGAHKVVTEETPELRQCLADFQRRWEGDEEIVGYEVEEVEGELESIRETLDAAEEFLRLNTPPEAPSNEMMAASAACMDRTLGDTTAGAARGLARNARRFLPEGPKKK